MNNYQEYVVRVYPNYTEWYNQNNQRHREDGPAVEYTNGDKFWYKNDQLHREDGPAIEYANGKKSWFLEGQEYTKQESRFNPMSYCSIMMKIIKLAIKNINYN